MLRPSSMSPGHLQMPELEGASVSKELRMHAFELTGEAREEG